MVPAVIFMVVRYGNDIILCYLDFKGAFPSADHDHLVITLTFLGLPEDFINAITNIYNGATTEFVTPHGHTPPTEIKRGALQGDPSPRCCSIS